MSTDLTYCGFWHLLMGACRPVAVGRAPAAVRRWPNKDRVFHTTRRHLPLPLIPLLGGGD
jgi:hypothetical protein